MNILQLPEPSQHLPERWRAYADWLTCQANPSFAYAEHAHLSEQDIPELKQDFERNTGISLDDYIRLRRISFLLSRSQSHSQYRAELSVEMMDTPLGQMLAVFSEKGLCMLKFVAQKGVETELLAVQREKQALFMWRETPKVVLLREELAQYFKGALKQFSIPVDLVGGEMHQEVWRSMMAIPYGQTRTYVQQAACVEKSNAARHIAAAANQNKISIVIPCHRISGSDHLSYHGKELLAFEQQQVNQDVDKSKLASVVDKEESVLPTPVGFGWSRS